MNDFINLLIYFFQTFKIIAFIRRTFFFFFNNKSFLPKLRGYGGVVKKKNRFTRLTVLRYSPPIIDKAMMLG